MDRRWIFAVLFVSAAVRAADFDEAGGLTSVTHDGAYLPILAGYVVESKSGERAPITAAKALHLEREGDRWHGAIELPSGRVHYEAEWSGLPGKLRFKGSLRASGKKPVSIAGIDYQFWIPQERFAGGQLLRIQPEDGSSYRRPLKLPATETAGALVHEKSTGITFIDARKNWSVGIQLPEALDITVEEPPTPRRRAYGVRIRVHDGALRPGETVAFAFILSTVGTAGPEAAAPTPPTS